MCVIYSSYIEMHLIEVNTFCMRVYHIRNIIYKATMRYMDSNIWERERERERERVNYIAFGEVFDEMGVWRREYVMVDGHKWIHRHDLLFDGSNYQEGMTPICCICAFPPHMSIITLLLLLLLLLFLLVVVVVWLFRLLKKKKKKKKLSRVERRRQFTLNHWWNQMNPSNFFKDIHGN